MEITEAMVEAGAMAISRSFHEEGFDPEYDDAGVWDEFKRAARECIEAALAARKGNGQ